MAIRDIIGKAVTLTGNDEVGYGSEGNAVFGVVAQIEKAGNTNVYPLGFDGAVGSATFKLADATKTELDSKATDDYVVTVKFAQMVENVPISATASKQPSAGGAVAVDGAGGLVKLDTLAVATSAATVVPFNAVATSVDKTAKTATIRIL